MSEHARRGWRWRGRILGSLVGPALLPLAIAAAETPALTVGMEPAPAATAPASTISLHQGVQLALDQQPNLAAARASLAAAQTQYRGLQALHVPPIFAGRELPIRRKQSSLGIIIAEAGLHQTEWEVVYAVKRTYFAALYAKAQKKVADEVVDNLKFYHARVREQVAKGESRDWTTNTVDKISVYLGLAEAKQAEAGRGIERATAALREAIGAGPDSCFETGDEPWPEPSNDVTREQIIALALSRRGEMVQAVNASAVVKLEIDAQGMTHLPTARTFAAVVDIHARPIPQGVFNGEYRPGALGIEMPVQFAGPRSARIERAKDLSVRAGAVVDKTHNLIALEAEDVYLRWKEASRKATQSLAATQAAVRLAKNTRDDFRGDQKVKIDDVLTNEVIASQAQSTYNKARFQLAIALAALERVTGGGFNGCLGKSP